MDLVPLRLDLLLKRMFQEYRQEGKIFDLPKSRFFRGDPALDTSIEVQGRRASTPLGPAAGPHTQMAQNIVLCWLGGSRAIELKTVQDLDELKIPRPCIHAANVGYNVEWSQELKLEASLREYVAAAMALKILQSSGLLGDEVSKQETVLEMSVGYSLDGIRSPRMRSWIESMKDARAVIDELRGCLTGPLAPYRDLEFPTLISDSVTLSTFHGCPAEEIEQICEFLLTELGVHVCIKMNPTLLGRQEIEHLLYDVLGYNEICLQPEAFDRDVQLAPALDMVRRLDGVARAQNRRLGVKLSNTLVIKNHESFFRDPVMYLSGPPLHVITLNLLQRFREQLGTAIPVSFSAGVDAQNFPDMVALDLAPVTTCTDLLRPGGYARLSRYMENLETRMREHGAATRAEFILRHSAKGLDAINATVKQEAMRAKLERWWQTGQPSLREVIAGSGDLESKLAAEAGLFNTAPIVARETADPRYAAARNRGVPRKIGSQLYLYDCINCDKCVPVCPNDANFVYETQPVSVTYHNYRVDAGELLQLPGEVLRIDKAHQIANYADFCNECGHCSVHCPEDGGPQREKPRFFGSLDTYRQARKQGFYVEYGQGTQAIYGTLDGWSYRLAVDHDLAVLDDGIVEAQLDYNSARVLGWRFVDDQPVAGHTVRISAFLELKYLLKAVSDPKHVNYVNVANVGV